VSPARDLAAAYAQRWEIETACDELKTHQRGARAVLRSKSPARITQEIWGHLCCHYAIRSLMFDAALHIASPDLAWVRGQDIEQLPDGSVSVTVSGGTRPRAVITLQAHETALLEIARLTRGGLLIGGTTRGRRNVTRGPMDRVVGGEDLPRLETARLRSTWLLTHLRARTPLPTLMTAAGLRPYARSRTCSTTAL